jgi:spore coat polysaccharide biosynthesis protein SpsF
MNEQEKFWKGKFGSKYILRNSSGAIKRNTDFFFKKIFRKIKNINSIIELGSNIGNNLDSLRKIYLKSKIVAVEINVDACNYLKKKKNYEVLNLSIEKLNLDIKFDLVLCKGILIHINPTMLNKVYDKIYKLSKKYILIAEYYSPKPEMVLYRNKKNKLFKRDFAGEMMKRYKLKLLRYGFVYRNDKYPQDDITWFLLKKIKFAR